MSDLKRRASICLSFEVLHKILNLSGDLNIIGAKVDLMQGSVDFILEGEGLRPTGRKEQIMRIPLTEALDWELR